MANFSENEGGWVGFERRRKKGKIESSMWGRPHICIPVENNKEKEKIFSYCCVWGNRVFLSLLIETRVYWILNLEFKKKNLISSLSFLIALERIITFYFFFLRWELSWKINVGFYACYLQNRAPLVKWKLSPIKETESTFDYCVDLNRFSNPLENVSTSIPVFCARKWRECSWVIGGCGESHSCLLLCC